MSFLQAHALYELSLMATKTICLDIQVLFSRFIPEVLGDYHQVPANWRATRHGDYGN